MLLVGVFVTTSILFLFAALIILAVAEQNPELVNCVRVIRMSLPVFVSKPV
jgi:Na+/H+-translocating membrane pyrophosphatase